VARKARKRFEATKRMTYDLFEALPLVRPELSEVLPPVSRRRDRPATHKSKAGRPRDPRLAMLRFLHDWVAWGAFDAACDLRDAYDTARRGGIGVKTVLLRSMTQEYVDATIKVGDPVLRRARQLRQRRRRALTDTCLLQACGLTARHRPGFLPLNAAGWDWPDGVIRDHRRSSRNK
jgi:hypothetical protein